MKLARYMTVSSMDLGLLQNQILIELISYGLELLLSDQYLSLIHISSGQVKQLEPQNNISRKVWVLPRLFYFLDEF